MSEKLTGEICCEERRNFFVRALNTSAKDIVRNTETE